MRNALDDVTKILLDMRKAGVLKCRYYLEENKKLQKAIIAMVKQDVTV